MKDCDQDIRNYHDDEVKLPSTKRDELTARRDANRQRVKNGLASVGQPTPEGFATQGSHAMRTTICEPSNDYDIDDGVIFAEADLVRPRGCAMTALEARQMVRNAVDDGSFKTKPEVRKNCVRVFYNDGPHVDIPVYRRKPDSTKELASADWKVSDPDGVNDWFKRSLASKFGEEAPRQMRILVRLVKSFWLTRSSCNLPPGFVLTVLVNEAYSAHDERLDRAFRQVLQALYNRLCGSLLVCHPVVNENLAEADDVKTRNLRNMLAPALDELRVLDQSNCTRSKALKAWKKVLHTDYFNDAISEAEADEKQQSTAVVFSVPHIVKPWGY